MKILGIDPGPTKSAWALLDVQKGVWSWLKGGMIYSTYDGISEACELFFSVIRPDNCFVEVPRGYAYDFVRVAALLDTANVAGMTYGILKGAKLDTIEITARDWRSKFIGIPNCTDSEIKVEVEKTVRNLPSRTNEHVRDSIGVAIGGHNFIHGS